MDRLLEIGEIGIMRDIPAELTKLTDNNQMLKAKNSKQKTTIIILVAVIIGAVIYIQKKKAITKNEMTE